MLIYPDQAHLATPPLRAETLTNDQSGTGPEDELKALREKALEASYDEYKELSSAWRHLDTKAQGNITIAGIFVAGAFAYLTKVTSRPDVYEQVFFVFAIIFLVISIVLSLIVLWIRRMPPHHLGDSMRKMVSDLEGRTDEEINNLLTDFYEMHANSWGASTDEFVASNEKKGECLWVGQIFLVLAIFAATALAITKMLSWNWPRGGAG